MVRASRSGRLTYFPFGKSGGPVRLDATGKVDATTLPALTPATATALGSVKQGTGTTISPDGTITVAAAGAGSPPIYLLATGYGVVGDGSTNSTSALNAALADAATVGATVILPLGTILLTPGAVTVSRNVTLIGTNGSQIYLGAASKGTIIRPAATATTGALIAMTDESAIGHMSFVGTTAQVGVKPGQMCNLEHLNITGCGVGIDFNYGGNGTQVAHCRIHENGIGIQAPVDSHFNDVIVNANTNMGFWIPSGCNLNMVTNCRVEWNNAENIHLDSCTNNVFSNCTIDRAGRAGIRCGGVTTTSFTGMNIGRCGRDQGGSVGNADDCAIRLTNCRGVVFSGCPTWVYGNDGGGGYVSPFYAVYDGGGNTNCLIRNNILVWHANSATATGGPINTTATFGNLATENAVYWA